jgi:carbon monoxide dehydrogenase subunit G
VKVIEKILGKGNLMFKIILIIVFLLIAAVLIFAATKPDSFRIERSRSIKASPEAVSALLIDFKQWSAWSPWEEKDPGMQRRYSGAPSGVGAVYGWEGNKNVGKGRMEILDVQPQKVTIQLDFLAPFEAHNTAEFTLQPEGDSTKLTWAMFGPANYLNKIMTTLMSMEKMVGPDFEAGLTKLKAAAEK